MVYCTAVGGWNGVGVEIPQALWVDSGDVVFTVCDEDECVKGKRLLRQWPADSETPGDRLAMASFRALGRQFDEGKAQMRVDLHDSDGSLVATRTETIRLHQSWPNGRECDGDGFVSGGFSMKPSDRVKG